VGLVIGGGNSKGQSEWSNFIFPRSGRLAYVPSSGEVRENQVVLSYGDNKASLELSPESKSELRIKAALLDTTSSATGQLLLHLKAGNSKAGGLTCLQEAR
jgi:hypothetical protein